MKIADVVCSAGRTGFYFDDQRAIKKGAAHDGMFYSGETVTEGFTSVRQAGESISVMIILEDGQIAYGDCAAVQYSGAGGRDPLFLAKDFIPLIDKYIKPELVGKEADNFRSLCEMMEAITIDGKRLHTAIRYGVSQAILDAVAKATNRLMCEVVADEYGCTVRNYTEIISYSPTLIILLTPIGRLMLCGSGMTLMDSDSRELKLTGRVRSAEFSGD